MSSIIDLDSDTCSSDVIDAIFYVKGTTFKISRKNPYFEEIRKMGIEVLKVDGDQVYFKIRRSG
jgi:HSP90 family molecular chaperone